MMLLDHHGNRDTINENILAQPRAARDGGRRTGFSPQPGEEVVTRMASQGLYSGPRGRLLHQGWRRRAAR